jgi:ribosomal protein S18 acetylase RimI-like enzyme
VKLFREHNDESLHTICYIHQPDGDDVLPDSGSADFVGIDENYLAWLYVDPEYQNREISRRLLKLAVGLIGPGAWVVVSTDGRQAEALFKSQGLRFVETFESDAGSEPCIGVHLALTPGETCHQ